MVKKRNASDTGVTPECSARLVVSQKHYRALARLERTVSSITKLVNKGVNSSCKFA